MNSEKQYQRFIENFDFNYGLALETEKPHLARWAYGACEEWIKDIEGELKIESKLWVYQDLINARKRFLSTIKEKLRTKFSDNQILMEMLK